MIKDAYAVYTGGNIWLFYGQLKDGNLSYGDAETMAEDIVNIYNL